MSTDDALANLAAKNVDADDLVTAYDYVLPPELIAQQPLPKRDQSRLMTVSRRTGQIRHHHFSKLPELLRPGDLLVVNETRVVPARLYGIRKLTGGKWEGLFLRDEGDGLWRLIGKTRGHVLPGEEIVIRPRNSTDRQLSLVLHEEHAGGAWTVRVQSPEFAHPLQTFDLLSTFGEIPLPHYMQRDVQELDQERYQTTYANRPGAVAAPTAGLHFTPELLSACQSKGIDVARVTLHVGLGTFRPIAVDKLSEHQMHSEWCELSSETAAAIRAAKTAGGRIVAVGTTSARTLESAAASGELQAFQGETSLFIRPPYQFRAVDALITNFHLPRSTLLVMVSALMGRDLILQAYSEAISQRYRFYSYGDAMFLEP